MKEVPGYPTYMVDESGNVFNKIKDRFMKPFLNGYGYWSLNIKNDEGYRTNVPIHKLVTRAFLGDRGSNFVNHINGIKTDNRIENLEYVTQRENNHHALRIGLKKVAQDIILTVRLAGKKNGRSHLMQRGSVVLHVIISLIRGCLISHYNNCSCL